MPQARGVSAKETQTPDPGIVTRRRLKLEQCALGQQRLAEIKSALAAALVHRDSLNSKVRRVVPSFWALVPNPEKATASSSTFRRGSPQAPTARACSAPSARPSCLGKQVFGTKFAVGQWALRKLPSSTEVQLPVGCRDSARSLAKEVKGVPVGQRFGPGCGKGSEDYFQQQPKPDTSTWQPRKRHYRFPNSQVVTAGSCSSARASSLLSPTLTRSQWPLQRPEAFRRLRASSPRQRWPGT